jgi:type II secretory pathway pseudopilin PulG
MAAIMQDRHTRERDTMKGIHQKGHTLLEVLIVLGISVVVLGAIYSAVLMAQQSSVSVERKVIAQQDARAALEIMSMEIQMASYNPNFVTGMWLDGPSGSCGNVSATQNYKGLQEATANSITVEMDLSEDSDFADTNEIIRYNLDTANQYITRQTSCGGGAQPFLGNQIGQQRDIRVVNAAAGVPLFRYYDGNGTVITAANLPARIPDIRVIELTLVVDTEGVDPNLNQRRRTIYTNRVIPRNHALN